MDNIGQQLLLQFVLILLNAFFAATEIAVISLNENKLRRQAEEGDKKAAKMLPMVTEPSSFLSTIQIGITLAGFLGSAFAADSFSEPLVNWLVNTCGVTALSQKTLSTLAVIAITIVLSYFTLILGELVPKRVAMKKSEQLARAVSGVIRLLSIILRPVIWFLSASTNAVLRLLGINPKEENEAVSEDEIRLMIDIGEEKGTIAPDEKEMIENIFEFNNRTAADIMVHRTSMSVIWEDDTNEHILEMILKTGFSRFPVCGEDTDKVIGIMRTREFLINTQRDTPKPLSELIHSAHFVPETVRADMLFRDMQAKKIHMAIVVDEYGGTSGLVTMEDLLEEIVGNIYDELDEGTEPAIMQLEENLWRMPGETPLEELAETLDIEFDSESEEFGTLGGLILSCLTQIPADGSQPEVNVNGLHIKVENVLERKIVSALVAKPPAEEKESDKDKDNKDRDKPKRDSDFKMTQEMGRSAAK